MGYGDDYFSSKGLPNPDTKIITLDLDESVRKEEGIVVPKIFKPLNKPKPGCYAFIDYGNPIWTLYAGTARYLWMRLTSHLSKSSFLDKWYDNWQFEKVGGTGVVEVAVWFIDDKHRGGFELELINKLKPIYNVNMKKDTQ